MRPEAGCSLTAITRFLYRVAYGDHVAITDLSDAARPLSDAVRLLERALNDTADGQHTADEKRTATGTETDKDMTEKREPMHTPDQPETVVLDRRTGPHGEVVLRRSGELLQIIANGCFLMDTSDGRSERLLVRAALGALDGRPRPSLLLGGLGVGFSLAEAASGPRWGRITVVEREEAILDWHRSGPLAPYAAEGRADARTELVHADLLDHLHGARERYDALCLDIDNGPDWTVTDGNRSLYSPAGLAACRARLTPGGVLAVWSARHSPAFEDSLRNNGFTRVRTEETPVARGVPDVVHFAMRPA